MSQTDQYSRNGALNNDAYSGDIFDEELVEMDVTIACYECHFHETFTVDVVDEVSHIPQLKRNKEILNARHQEHCLHEPVVYDDTAFCY